MKRIAFPMIGIMVALLAMTAGGVDNIARGQSAPPPPTGVTAVNGSNPGEVVISWQAPPGSAPYRIGWMANPDYEDAGGAEGPYWAEEFRYSDIGNRGQTSHTTTRLTPGVHYWFIVGSKDNRYDELGWSQWAGLPLAGDSGSGSTCPISGQCPTIESSQFRMSDVKYKAIDAGKNHSCGIKQDDTVECWGDNTEGQIDAPSGTFEHISAGGVATCAIDTDDELVCWGHPRLQRVPNGKYTEVSVGDEHACAITVPVKNNNRSDENRVNCWGLANNDGRIANQPENGWLWTDVGAGSDYSCGIYTYQGRTRLNCWGNNANNYVRFSSNRSLQDGSAGSTHFCALYGNGAAECHGRNVHNQVSGLPNAQNEGAPDDFYRYDAISAGEGHTCGLRITGNIRCWGDNLRGQAMPPGMNDELNANLQGVGDFKAVSAGGAYTCGLRDDGTAVCWGYNVRGQADPP